MAKVKKHKRSFIIILFAVVLCACFAISLFSLVRDIDNIKKDISAVETATAEQNAENAALRNKINNGNTDEYVESIARDKLGYVMPGERVYYEVSVND
ncbi:MAG: septum formation initiator family protein [Clostridia bacterium]|nr:septum formation initiator family protein [Clostridia bacterium]